MTPNTTTATTTTFSQRAQAFTDVLDAAGGRWDAPTPCDGWTVRDVVQHVIDTERDFLVRQGHELAGAPDPENPADAWRTHRAAVEEVLAGDGVAEREYDGYFGRTTVGATLADFYGWDLVVHGSDVARATGQPWEISEKEASELHDTADGWGDALYSEGICAAPVPVPADASPTQRLLGRLGRDPHWQPGRA